MYVKYDPTTFYTLNLKQKYLLTGNGSVHASTSAAEPCSQIELVQSAGSNQNEIEPAQPARSNIQVLSSNTCPDWAYKFQIPWADMPQELLKSLEKSERPNPKLRREMIRIIVHHVQKVCKHPLKRHLEILARKVVEKYPDSFQDRLNDSVVGSDYCSLQRQLLVRSENVNRSTQPIKRKESFNTETTNASVTASPLRDSYGCVNWQPEAPSYDDDKYSFYEQRCLINSGSSLPEITKKYPELMTEVGILTHFKELVNIDLVSRLEEGFSNKGQRIFRYFQGCRIDRLQKILDEKENYETTTNNNVMNSAATIIHLIQTYFLEDVLFRFVEETTLPHEIQCDSLPVTPCLIVYGTSIMYSKVFALAIDQKIFLERIINFNSALAVLFASFYVFNIQYQEGACSTLEFIQRCFVNINPGEGSKAKRKRNQNNHNVCPKVLKLVNKLANYEWLLKSN